MDSKYRATLLIGAAVALAAATHASPARADTILINDQLTVRKSDVVRPARGATMAAVESKFGAPRDKHAAVGTPPITRWDYGQFAVFFEKDRVIDAVVPPAAADTPAASESAAVRAASPSSGAAPATAAPAAAAATAAAASTPPATVATKAKAAAPKARAPGHEASASPAPLAQAASLP